MHNVLKVVIGIIFALVGATLVGISLMLLIAMHASAASPTIPTKYHGVWCRIGDHPYFTSWSVGAKCDGPTVKIGAHQYEAAETLCKPTHVKVDKGNFYLGAHKITFACLEVDQNIVEVFSFATWSKGQATASNKRGDRLYIEVPETDEGD